MLEKLRTRHPIDIPAEDWGRRKPILAILGGIAVLFLFVPLLMSLAGALLDGNGLDLPGIVLVAAGFGVLLLALLIYGARGKVGHDR